VKGFFTENHEINTLIIGRHCNHEAHEELEDFVMKQEK